MIVHFVEDYIMTTGITDQIMIDEKKVIFDVSFMPKEELWLHLNRSQGHLTLW